MSPEIVSLGEPLLEFNAIESGSMKEIHRYDVGWGGDTSNFSIAVSRMGGSAGYICRLGNDGFGELFLNLWEMEGVDTKKVIIEDGGQTGVYFISRLGEEHSFTYYRNDSAASHISPKDVPPEYISKAKVFHSSGISQAISNSACEAVFHAMNIAREAGVLISYDPNVRLELWDVRRAKAIILEAISLSDFVLPSLEDAIILTGLTKPEDIVLNLLERGPKVITLKMGRQGTLLGTVDGIHYFKSFEVDVVDTTGAGDTFDGAFLTAYLRGCPLSECVCFANAAAALAITDCGAVKPIPRKSEVDALLSSLI